MIPAPKRILIVDDSGFMRAIMKLSLEKTAGWEVLIAKSGEEALVQSELMPDAILLDVVMPGMDGPTVMRKLRANEMTKNIPVIIISATDQQRDIDMLEGLGAAGVIAKPFDPATLGAQVRQVLGWSV